MPVKMSLKAPKNRGKATGPLSLLLVAATTVVLKPTGATTLPSSAAASCGDELIACLIEDETCQDCMNGFAEIGIERLNECLRRVNCEILGLDEGECNDAVWEPTSSTSVLPSSLVDASTDEVCAASTVQPCCIDALLPSFDCIGNAAFVNYWDCIIDISLDSLGLDGECATLTCDLEVAADNDGDGDITADIDGSSSSTSVDTGDDGSGGRSINTDDDGEDGISVDTDDGGSNRSVDTDDDDGGSSGPISTDQDDSSGPVDAGGGSSSGGEEVDPNSSPSGGDSGAGSSSPRAVLALVVGLTVLAKARIF